MSIYGLYNPKFNRSMLILVTTSFILKVFVIITLLSTSTIVTNSLLAIFTIPVSLAYDFFKEEQGNKSSRSQKTLKKLLKELKESVGSELFDTLNKLMDELENNKLMDESENNKLMDESKNNKLMDESENNDDLKQLTDIDDNNVFSILSDFISRTNNENISMKEILFRNTKEGRDRAIKRTQKVIHYYYFFGKAFKIRLYYFKELVNKQHKERKERKEREERRERREREEREECEERKAQALVIEEVREQLHHMYVERTLSIAQKVYEFFNMIGGKDKMQIKSFSAEEISELSSDDIDYILAKLAIGEERKIRSVEIV
ncbi:hypothetical protein RhiirA5_382322 [Rhizophagus irregularis]|uniref:Uncharacterized protein n=1 Tax=Rhizophagus irregularis TaxID=588596 RepID=A0A2N0P1A9_9GLOM|nr:hypothetical protein RhiirA5_382322 [Rhizophagus irregularis]